MVFKQWTERAPRHIFEDSTTITSSPIPRIQITTPLKGHTIIIPNTLSFIKDALLKQGTHKSVGSIKLFRIITQQIESEEFIEDEQLYKASESHQEELSYEVEITQVNGVNIIVVPVFQDVINYEIIARELLKNDDDFEILTITPGTLPFDSIIAEIGSNFTSYPQLVPPFIITGISGSLVSNSTTLKKPIETLVLQSEGVSGYEKINNDSISELVQYLQQKYSLDKSNFIRDVESLVHTGSSVNNFGLYL